MTAKDYLLIDFIKGEEKFFLIPHYQRKYTWEARKEVKELIDDIESFVNTNDREYILGALITKRIFNQKQYEQILLVDGQQRITTFLLIICALLKIVKTNFSELSDDGKELELKLKEIIKTDNSIRKFKLERIEDQYTMEVIINGDEDNVGHASNKNNNYFSVFEYLVEKFNKYDFKELKIFFEKGLRKLKIANIQLDESEDENIVFETFNSKGKSLNSAELIKNYVIMSLENNDLEKEKIKEFENKFFESFDDQKIMNEFWRQWLVLKTGKLFSKNENSKELYFEFKKLKDNKNIDLEFMNEIYYHKSIWDYLMLTKIDSKKILTKDRILFNQNLQSYYGILAAIIYRNSDFTSNQLVIKNENIIKNSINFISRLIVARVLCSFGRVESNRAWAKLGHDLYISSNNFEADFTKFIIEHLENTTNKYKMPSWEEISAIEKRDLYTDHKSNLKWIFAALEENLSKLTKSVEIINKMQIEHIFPQIPTKQQADEWNVLFDEKWFEWKDTLGNLSIIEPGTNQRLGNKPFNEKQELLKENSYLKINKIIYEYQEWNLETLKNRAKNILDQIKKVYGFKK